MGFDQGEGDRRLRLYKPALEDLDYRRSLLADPNTMSYNEKWGGAIDFPEKNWEPGYKSWVSADESQRYYRYLYAEDFQCFVGEVAYHYDAACQAHMVNLLVEARYRGRGYGNEGLLLLIKAAKENGITRLCDDIAIDNPSISLFLRVGFTEVWRSDACIMVELVL